MARKRRLPEKRERKKKRKKQKVSQWSETEYTGLRAAVENFTRRPLAFYKIPWRLVARNFYEVRPCSPYELKKVWVKTLLPRLCKYKDIDSSIVKEEVFQRALLRKLETMPPKFSWRRVLSWWHQSMTKRCFQKLDKQVCQKDGSQDELSWQERLAKISEHLRCKEFEEQDEDVLKRMKLQMEFDRETEKMEEQMSIDRQLARYGCVKDAWDKKPDQKGLSPHLFAERAAAREKWFKERPRRIARLRSIHGETAEDEGSNYKLQKMKPVLMDLDVWEQVKQSKEKEDKQMQDEKEGWYKFWDRTLGAEKKSKVPRLKVEALPEADTELSEELRGFCRILRLRSALHAWRRRLQQEHGEASAGRKLFRLPVGQEIAPESSGSPPWATAGGALFRAAAKAAHSLRVQLEGSKENILPSELALVATSQDASPAVPAVSEGDVQGVETGTLMPPPIPMEDETLEFEVLEGLWLKFLGFKQEQALQQFTKKSQVQPWLDKREGQLYATDKAYKRERSVASALEQAGGALAASSWYAFVCRLILSLHNDYVLFVQVQLPWVRFVAKQHSRGRTPSRNLTPTWCSDDKVMAQAPHPVPIWKAVLEFLVLRDRSRMLPAQATRMEAHEEAVRQLEVRTDKLLDLAPNMWKAIQSEGEPAERFSKVSDIVRSSLEGPWADSVLACCLAAYPTELGASKELAKPGLPHRTWRTLLRLLANEPMKLDAVLMGEEELLGLLRSKLLGPFAALTKPRAAGRHNASDERSAAFLRPEEAPDVDELRAALEDFVEFGDGANHSAELIPLPRFAFPPALLYVAKGRSDAAALWRQLILEELGSPGSEPKREVSATELKEAIEKASKEFVAKMKGEASSSQAPVKAAPVKAAPAQPSRMQRKKRASAGF